MNKQLLVSVVLLGYMAKITALVGVDQIELVVMGEQSSPITYTDLAVKKTVQGTKRVPQDVISNTIMVQQAQAEKMVQENTAFDTFVERMRRQEDMTLEDIKELAAHYGMTLEELKKLLQDQYAQAVFQQRKVSSIMAASESLLEEEYKKHPVYEDATYTIQVAKVSGKDHGIKTAGDLKKALAAGDFSVGWSDPIVLEKSQIAESKQFITKLKQGAIKVVNLNDTFEVYKLVASTPQRKKSLEESKAEIIARINQENHEKVMKQYQNMVEKYYTILPVAQHG